MTKKKEKAIPMTINSDDIKKAICELTSSLQLKAFKEGYLQSKKDSRLIKKSKDGDK